MGLTDKFKNLQKQAQDAIAEHKDDIQSAVGAAGLAANEKTQGKYANKIAKVGEKLNSTVDKLAPEDASASTGNGAQTTPEPEGPASEPAPQAAAPASAPPPDFE